MARSWFLAIMLLALRAQAGPTYAEEKARIENARISRKSRDLRSAIDALIPFWFGTPWTFEGHTESPREGTVACGYFVSTVLRDAGFRLNRYRLAQQAAAVIVTTLVGDAAAQPFGKADPDVVARALATDPGLYVVGLDFHVGFVRSDGKTATFCHSNYQDAATGVTCEPALTSLAWHDSTTFIAGRIDSPAMIRKWIAGSRIRVEKR